MHRRNEDNDGDRKFSFLCDGLVVASWNKSCNCFVPNCFISLVVKCRRSLYRRIYCMATLRTVWQENQSVFKYKKKPHFLYMLSSCVANLIGGEANVWWVILLFPREMANDIKRGMYTVRRVYTAWNVKANMKLNVNAIDQEERSGKDEPTVYY
jgi:hypothetical protein